MKRKSIRKKSMPARKSSPTKTTASASTKLDRAVAEAILGIDTLFGGDVMNPSGTGRFLADCWFSDAKLPKAYTDPAAARLREAGGATAKDLPPDVLRRYLDN